MDRMTVGEINDYITAQNNFNSEFIIISSWKTINFLAQMISGKMKDLENYLPKKIKKDGSVVKSYKERLIEKAKIKAKQLGHI
jgi:hypothetical protein